MAQTRAQLNTTVKVEEEKIGVRWTEEVCDIVDEKGLEGHRMDHELWWLETKDFNHVDNVTDKYIHKYFWCIHFVTFDVFFNISIQFISHFMYPLQSQRPHGYRNSQMI
jgi:hypothetical protein